MCGRGRVLADPRLSPDGEQVAFVATTDGRAALVVVPAAGGPEVVVTSDPRPAATDSYGGGTFDWTPAGDALVYVGADGLLYDQPVSGGPPWRLVDSGPVSSPAVSPDGHRVAYVRDGRYVAVATRPGRSEPGPEPGRPGPEAPERPGPGRPGPGRPERSEDCPWPVRLSRSADFAFDPAWSPDGRSVVWHEWDDPDMPWDRSRIMLAPPEGFGRPIALPLAAPVATGGTSPSTGAVSSGQPRFSPDGLRLAFLCDAGGWLNLWCAGPDGQARPLVAEQFEHGEPSWGPGQRSYAWSPDGRRVVFCRNEGGFGRLCIASLDDHGRSVGVDELDRGVYRSLSWAGGLICGLRCGARTPDQIVVLDASPAKPAPPPPPPASPPPASPPPASPVTRRRTLARGPVAGFESAGLVEPEAVSWESDAVAPLGTSVPGRLYRATTDPDAMLLLWIHGGPTSQDRVGFDRRIAFFCAQGANVLAVDYRGSSGWGRDYAQALRGRWGRLDVADCAAGLRAAAARRWGHPRRMVPVGRSAGGLTVLLLLAHHGELCAAGVDLYGVTDLFDLDETTHRFEAHYLSSLVGPLPAAADHYRDRSPIKHATGIAGPLLVLQGSADQVVPPAQSDSLVAAVRAGGGTVDYHVYDGEGHGWNRPETVEDELQTTWAFLRRHVLRRR